MKVINFSHPVSKDAVEKNFGVDSEYTEVFFHVDFDSDIIEQFQNVVKLVDGYDAVILPSMAMAASFIVYSLCVDPTKKVPVFACVYYNTKNRSPEIVIISR